jgi:hypothetical protein
MNDAASGDGKKSAAASATGMSLEEAHLILNVKKEESMEKILEVSGRVC